VHAVGSARSQGRSVSSRDTTSCAAGAYNHTPPVPLSASADQLVSYLVFVGERRSRRAHGLWASAGRTATRASARSIQATGEW
jgi:hypothetical protein